MKRLNKAASTFFRCCFVVVVVVVSYCSFSKGNFRFLFDFTAVGFKCRVAAVKCLPILYHSADYMLISFENQHSRSVIRIFPRRILDR